MTAEDGLVSLKDYNPLGATCLISFLWCYIEKYISFLSGIHSKNCHSYLLALETCWERGYCLDFSALPSQEHEEESFLVWLPEELCSDCGSSWPSLDIAEPSALAVKGQVQIDHVYISVHFCTRSNRWYLQVQIDHTYIFVHFYTSSSRWHLHLLQQMIHGVYCFIFTSEANHY